MNLPDGGGGDTLKSLVYQYVDPLIVSHATLSLCDPKDAALYLLLLRRAQYVQFADPHHDGKHMRCTESVAQGG